jgi:hypothetical protein
MDFVIRFLAADNNKKANDTLFFLERDRARSCRVDAIDTVVAGSGNLQAHGAIIREKRGRGKTEGQSKVQSV